MSQDSYGVVGKLFLFKIGPEIKKKNLILVIIYGLLTLEKLSYIMNLVTPPKGPILDRFFFFFFVSSPSPSYFQ
jgi:hypothetical protein